MTSDESNGSIRFPLFNGINVFPLKSLLVFRRPNAAFQPQCELAHGSTADGAGLSGSPGKSDLQDVLSLVASAVWTGIRLSGGSRVECSQLHFLNMDFNLTIKGQPVLLGIKMYLIYAVK